MNLAFVVTRGDDLGGAQVHVRDLCLQFRAAGHRVTVLAGGAGAFTADLDRLGVPRRNLRWLRMPIHPAHDAAALIEIVGALRALRPDLVLAHSAKAGMLGRAAARVLGIPSVFTPHGWSIGDRISRRQGRVFRVLERLAARGTGRIVNVCEYERRLALDCGIAGAEKMAVVYNGLPDVDESLRARPAEGPARILMVARMAPPKDHAGLLDAVAGLPNAPWSLAFVGGGPREAALRRQTEALGLADRVRFLGFRGDVAPLLAGAHALVLCSASEAFPYVVLEAMRAGLPVVASDVGGIPEAVVHGETGLLVPRGNPAALRDALALLIARPRLRKQLGDAGRRRFLERFTLRRMFEATLGVYREVLGQRASVPQYDAFARSQADPVDRVGI